MLEHGTPVAAALALIGVCNRCGLCCRVERNGEWLNCEHLVVEGEVGQAEATRCGVYQDRVPDMPIRMLRADGTEGWRTVCGMGSVGETLAILERGIGKGCSLDVKLTPLRAKER